MVSSVRRGSAHIVFALASLAENWGERLEGRVAPALDRAAQRLKPSETYPAYSSNNGLDEHSNCRNSWEPAPTVDGGVRQG